MKRRNRIIIDTNPKYQSFNFSGLILKFVSEETKRYLNLGTMDEAGLSLKLSTVGKQMWCIWLQETDASEYRQAPQSHLSIIEWLIKLSSCLTVLRCSGNLFSKCSRFPYKKNTVNEWFTLPVEDAELRGQPVNMINVDEDGKKRKCYATQNGVNKFPESLSYDNYEVFFHGTSHKSAQNIMSGIDVNKGRQALDFSSKDGFYLGDNFEQALRWTTSRKHTPPAVLVFRVKRNQLRGENNEKGLDLRNDQEKWKEVVTKFRSRDSDQIKEVRKCLEKYEFIEGPMALSLHPKLKPGSYQLCVKKNNCAELFNQSIHSVVFFER